MRRTVAQILASMENRRIRTELARQARLEQQRERKRQRERELAAIQGRERGTEEAMLHERALTLGIEGERSRIYRGCNHCHGMPWRRHWSGCRGCGEAYAHETVEVELPAAQSSIGRCEDAA
jgi:hypothetical protein